MSDCARDRQCWEYTPIRRRSCQAREEKWKFSPTAHCHMAPLSSKLHVSYGATRSSQRATAPKGLSSATWHSLLQSIHVSAVASCQFRASPNVNCSLSSCLLEPARQRARPAPPVAPLPWRVHHPPTQRRIRHRHPPLPAPLRPQRLVMPPPGLGEARHSAGPIPARSAPGGEGRGSADCTGSAHPPCLNRSSRSHPANGSSISTTSCSPSSRTPMPRPMNTRRRRKHSSTKV